MLNIKIKSLDKTEELKFKSTQELHCKLVRLLDIAKEQVILDVGCGAGASIACILQQCSNVSKIIGVDKDEKFLEQIVDTHCEKIKSGCLELIQYDVDQPLPFEQKMFDRIICQNVMECVLNKEQLVDEFYRLLKPDGKVLVSHHDFDTIVFNSSYKDLTRKLIHCYTDTTQEWQKTSDGQMGRKLHGLMNKSNFKNHHVGSLVFSEGNYADTAYGFRMAHWIVEVSKASGQFQDHELNEWLEDLKMLDKKGAYFFSINLIYVLGLK